MAFKDLNEVFDARLALPVNGKTYYIPEPDAELGLWCKAMATAGYNISAGITPADDSLPNLQLDDDEEDAMYRRLLGPVYDELLADGVGPVRLHFIGATAFIWVALGPDVAEAYWGSGGDPKVSAAGMNRAGRRAAKSTPTAAASTTKRAGSTSGTTSRPTKSTRPRAPRSPGK